MEKYRLLVSKTKSGHIRSISIVDQVTNERFHLSKDHLPKSTEDMEELNAKLKSQYGDTILLNKNVQ